LKVSELPNDKLVAAFVQLRDQRAQRKAAFTNADNDDKAKQEKIESILLQRFEKDGLESVRTGFGTAYKATKSSATVADKETFLQHVRDNGAWELLEARCSKDAVKQYRAEHNDLPPGINWYEEVGINIRRS